MINSHVNILVKYMIFSNLYKLPQDSLKQKMNLDQFSYAHSTKNGDKKQKKPQGKQGNQSAEMMIQIQNQKKHKSNKLKSKSVINPIDTLEKILQWRKHNMAPVDTIGCERLADKSKSIQIQKYQTLVSLILSVQTKDEITSMITNRLKLHGLQPKIIADMKQPELVSMIFQANFNKRKAKQLIEISNIILTKGMPTTKGELLALPGVGVKIAMIYLRVAQNKIEGIGVDTHVHRITNLLGWVKTITPNETEAKLQQIFPKNYWRDINIALVGFGQILCKAKKQLCEQCPVNKICPSSNIILKDLQW